MRILDQHHFNYAFYTYDIADGFIDGVSVAHKTGKSLEIVYKTLVAQSSNKSIYVFVIPVAHELDLKQAAKPASEKKIEMISVKDIQKLTGYIRGGCSPIGMKKHYPTFIEEKAQQLDKIIVSGGKKGLQIELDLADLCKTTNAELVHLIKE